MGTINIKGIIMSIKILAARRILATEKVSPYRAGCPDCKAAMMSTARMISPTAPTKCVNGHTNPRSKWMQAAEDFEAV
jgi:hypothetical protein